MGEPCGGISAPQQRVTASLRRRARANAPAASYWLHRVLDDGDAGTRRVHRARGVRGGACNAALSLTYIYVFMYLYRGGSVAEWLACWTQAQGSNLSRDAVG